MNFQEPLSGLFERIARAHRAAWSARARAARFRGGRCLCLAGRDARPSCPVRDVNRVPLALLKGIDARARHAACQYRAVRARASRQQCAAVGRARHGQELAGQGRAWRGRGAQARRDPSRGHPVAAASACAICARRRTPLHPVLRRPLLRGARHLVQIAEGRARRRHRGKARQRAVLRDLEPEASDAARDGRQRALDRHQSRRSGRGEALAVGSFRAVDRLPQLQPGRLSRHGARLCRAITACAIEDASLRQEALAWAHVARQPLGPRRLAVHPGPRRQTWDGSSRASRRWPPGRSCIWSDRPDASPCAARNAPAAG